MNALCYNQKLKWLSKECPEVTRDRMIESISNFSKCFSLESKLLNGANELQNNSVKLNYDLLK
jgi:hypothetical protein